MRKNKVNKNEYMKNYRKTHKRKYPEYNPIKIAITRLKRYKINISYEEYDKLMHSTETCQICDKYDKRALSVDHDHKTGNIRGLLCSSCNIHLGWYENNKQRIENYLEKNTPFTSVNMEEKR